MALRHYKEVICHEYSGIPVVIPSHEFLYLCRFLGDNVRRF